MAAHLRYDSDVCKLWDKEVSGSALSYWSPATTMAQQNGETLKLVARATTKFPALKIFFREEYLATAKLEVEQDYRYGGGPSGGSAPAGDAGSVASSGGPASAAPPPVPAAPPKPGTSNSVVNAAVLLPRDVALKACMQNAGSTLYIQIYEEDSRAPATALRQMLQSVRDSGLVVAPIENVTRRADLRQQRRPVPWPRPTLLLHNAESRDCANAVSRYIGAPWVESGALANSGRASGTRIRELPASLKAQPGVIELWLPPVEQLLSRDEQRKAELLVGKLELRP